MRKKANTLYDEDLQVDGIQGQQNKLVGEAKAYVAREQDQETTGMEKEIEIGTQK